MFTLLSSAEGLKWTHYFNVSTFRGKMLIATIVFAAVLIIAGIAVFFARRKDMKKFALSAVVLSVFYAIGVIIANILNDRAEAIAAGEDFTLFAQGYQWQLLTVLILAIALCIAAIVCINKLVRPDNSALTKKIANISAIVLAAVAAVLFIASIVTNKGNIESLAPSTQILIIVSIFAVLIAGILFLVMGRKEREVNHTVAIVYAAVFIAVSFALSYIRVLKLPQGGSITLLSLLPIAVYSYMFGAKKGTLACFIYGILQAIQDPWIVHPIQFALDYLIAFGVFGLVGLFKDKGVKGFVIGMSVSVLLRYVCHFFSGSLYFGTYGADHGYSPWAWGAVYNLFVFADGIPCVIAGAILLSTRQIRGEIARVRDKMYEGTEDDGSAVPAEDADNG